MNARRFQRLLRRRARKERRRMFAGQLRRAVIECAVDDFEARVFAPALFPALLVTGTPWFGTAGPQAVC